MADATLRAAVEEMRAGLVDANLGAGLVKKRIARPGRGKSGGWRTVSTRADGLPFVRM